MMPGQALLRSRAASLWAFAARHEAWLVPAVLSGFSLLLLLALVLPRSTYSGNYTNDLMIFFDGAHRFLSGQLPNVDFHTPLGALTVVLPAFGLWMSGLGGMMPWATVAFAVVFMPFLIYICRSRLPLVYALGFGIYAILLVIAPVNVGEQVDNTSFAMFYNRFGYALLSLLFLLALPTKDGVQRRTLDGVAAAGLLLLMFYLKISYFMLGAAFILGLALLTRPRLPAIGALLATAAVIALVHVFWGGTATYLGDIGIAAEASGAVRGTLFTLSRVVLLNFMAVVIFLAVIAIALVRGVRWEIILLCLCMAAAGVLLLNQNAQVIGIVTLIPAALVATLAPGRDEPHLNAFWPQLASALMVAALVVPPATVSLVTIGYFSVRSARAQSVGPYEARFAGVIADEGASDAFEVGADVQRAAYRTGQPTIEMYNKMRNQRFKQVFSQPEYLRTLEDGVRLLGSDPRLSGKVFVFDMGNPFNALLGREPPAGVDAWNHNGRTMTAALYRPPEKMLADVDVVLVPKVSTELSTTQLMEQVYGPYLKRRFQLLATSDYWYAYGQRRETEAQRHRPVDPDRSAI
jgi:hypothetical protein